MQTSSSSTDQLLFNTFTVAGLKDPKSLKDFVYYFAKGFPINPADLSHIGFQTNSPLGEHPILLQYITGTGTTWITVKAKYSQYVTRNRTKCINVILAFPCCYCES